MRTGNCSGCCRGLRGQPSLNVLHYIYRLMRRTFHSLMPIRCATAGFTLIEILVVLGIMAILSVVFIGYGRESSKQLLLATSQTRTVGVVSRAKSLSISTFLGSIAVVADPDAVKLCAYGVHVDRGASEMFIFKDLAKDCAVSDDIYGGGDERLNGELDSFKLEASVLAFVDNPIENLHDIVFIPPDPKIIINGDATIPDAKIGLGFKDGSGSPVVIAVTNAGQITGQ